METLKQWAALGLYLGIGVILGCAIMLARHFDAGMAVGGLICIIGAGIYGFTVWKTGGHPVKDTRKEDS